LPNLSTQEKPDRQALIVNLIIEIKTEILCFFVG